MRRGSIVLAISFLFLLLPLVSSIEHGETSYGPHWDTSCNENTCQSTIYSYEKYWRNSSNDWEEMNESFYACSEGELTRYCSRDYYYQTIIDGGGNASASLGDSRFSMHISNFLDSPLSFNPVVDGSVVTYEDVIPSYVDIRYQYLPRKLKEEIIIKQLPRNLPTRDFNITFHVARDSAFLIEPTFICDARMVCRYIPMHFEDNSLKIEVPVAFLTNPNTTYPVIIDPTITLNHSYISWNGHVYFSEDDTHDPPIINYTRYNNPPSLTASLSSYRADIDWNISSIADGSVIRNVSVGLLANLLTFNSSQSSILSIMQMDKDRNGYPDTAGNCPDGNCLFYNDMGNGTEYGRTNITNSLVYRNITLSATAASNLQSKLATDSFSLGLITDFSGIVSIAARDYVVASSRPKLTIIHSYEAHNLTYDANGNMIQGFGKYLEYDGWHRVSKIRENNASGRIIEEYVYDHEGERLKKIEYGIDALGNNKTTYYISKEFIQIRYTNGTILNETYYYLNDKLVAMKNPDGSKLYYHPDHLGSTTLVTNQSGDVVEDDVYLPYGALYNGLGASRYLFTGKERDTGTGFDYFGARYYNSQFMHFLQCDTVKPNIYDPQALNCYSYVLNNPYRYTDPTGHFIDAVLDVGFIGYDVYTIIQDPHNSANYIALAADAVGFAVPGITGLGMAVRTAKGADKALEIATTADKLSDGVNGVKALERGKDVEKAAQVGGDYSKLQENFQRGRESEAFTLTQEGLQKNTQTFEVKVNGENVRTRPDSLGEIGNSVIEVKDRQSVSYTKQLQAQTELAKQKGAKPQLITGELTKLTKNVRDNFNVIRRSFLGPRR